MTEFRVSVPGKLILYGEHAVVYGKTAVAASLDLRTTLDLKELPDEPEYIVVSMPKTRLLVNVPVEQVREYFCTGKCPKLSDGHEPFHAYIQSFVEKIGYTNVQQKFGLEALFYLLVSISQTERVALRAFQIVVETALSISSGLGSSASLAVGLATVFVHWSHLQRNETTPLDAGQLEAISKYAFDCERIMHGTPSGVDNSVCTYGSIIEFRRGERPEPILGVKSMRVLLVDTRVQRSTKALVEKLGDLKRKYPNIFGPVVESIDNVSKEALSVIKRIREIPERLGEHLYAAYQELMVRIVLMLDVYYSYIIHKYHIFYICDIYLYNMSHF